MIQLIVATQQQRLPKNWRRVCSLGVSSRHLPKLLPYIFDNKENLETWKCCNRMGHNRQCDVMNGCALATSAYIKRHQSRGYIQRSAIFFHKIQEVSWWRHQMENFSALLSICAGNLPSPVNSRTRALTRSFDIFFDLRLNKRLSKQWWGCWFETPSRPLWRGPTDYLVTYTGNDEELDEYRIMYMLAWITIFLPRVGRFGRYFHAWKSLAYCLTLPNKLSEHTDPPKKQPGIAHFVIVVKDGFFWLSIMTSPHLTCDVRRTLVACIVTLYTSIVLARPKLALVNRIPKWFQSVRYFQCSTLVLMTWNWNRSAE